MVHYGDDEPKTNKGRVTLELAIKAHRGVWRYSSTLAVNLGAFLSTRHIKFQLKHVINMKTPSITRPVSKMLHIS